MILPLLPIQLIAESIEANPLGTLDFIMRTGTTGLLLVAAWLFITGKILPASVVERHTAQLNTLVSTSIADVIEKSVKEAVRVGMLEAWKEIDISYHQKGKANANREDVQKS